MVFVETKSGEAVHATDQATERVEVPDRGEAIDRVQALLGRTRDRFAAEDDQEQRWLAAQCSPRAAAVMLRMSMHALHLIDAIPAEQTVNIVGLARSVNVPKGTVSKIVRRFVADDLVTREALPDNRKEVHLRLTALGAEIQRAHRAMHEEIDRGLTEFLDRYSAEELSVITKVLTDLVRMPRDGVRFRPDLLDDGSGEPNLEGEDHDQRG